MIIRLDGWRQRLDEMPDNAAAIARKAHSDSWRVGDRPMVPSACRCDDPLWVRDLVSEVHEVETRCVKCGRRAPAVF
jgi:hypothetical protein